MPDAPVIVWCSKLCLPGSRAGKFLQILIPSLISSQAFIHLYRVSLGQRLNIFTNSSQKKTCIQLCLLFYTEIPAPSSWYLWIFYFRLRLTLYKWVFSASIQRPRLIRNWTILCQVISNYWVGKGLGFGDFFNSQQEIGTCSQIYYYYYYIGKPTQLFLSDYGRNAWSIRSTGESFVCLEPNPNPHPFLLVLVKENVTQSSLAARLWSFFKEIYIGGE